MRLLILAVAVCIVGGVRAEEPIHWYSSVEEASAQAISTNRPLMIDFWATWCLPCKAMEQEVYSTAEFRKATQKFLPVKIDFDKKTALARKYNVESLPTIVFADSYGDELFRYEGYLGAVPLLAVVSALPGDVTEFNRLNRILGRDKNDFEALESMGNGLKKAGLFRASSEYYTRALQQPAARSTGKNARRFRTRLDPISLRCRTGSSPPNGLRAASKSSPTVGGRGSGH